MIPVPYAGRRGQGEVVMDIGTNYFIIFIVRNNKCALNIKFIEKE